MSTRMQDTRISLAHGNGGRFMRELIDEIFARHLASPELDVQADAVPLALGSDEILFTTDGFTVQPLEFPGGDIGSLAVHGTTNDLAVAGVEGKDVGGGGTFQVVHGAVQIGLDQPLADAIEATTNPNKAAKYLITIDTPCYFLPTRS